MLYFCITHLFHARRSYRFMSSGEGRGGWAEERPGRCRPARSGPVEAAPPEAGMISTELRMVGSKVAQRRVEVRDVELLKR